MLFQVRVMDCYLHEGIKVLYRITMVILQLFYKYSTTSNSIWADEINNHGVNIALMNFCRQMPVIKATQYFNKINNNY